MSLHSIRIDQYHKLPCSFARGRKDLGCKRFPEVTKMTNVFANLESQRMEGMSSIIAHKEGR